MAGRAKALSKRAISIENGSPPDLPQDPRVRNLVVGREHEGPQ
jgi:hypothetical protein